MKNVLLASELVKNDHKDSVTRRCSMIINISKAFDSVQWSFVTTLISAINVPDRFIAWICKFIELTSFSVQINGELAGYFNSERCLRQGCSLSPYLFALCMQVLSKILDQAAEKKLIGYHPYCQRLSLTHLCFADDLLAFLMGKRHPLQVCLMSLKTLKLCPGCKSA